MQRPLTRVFVDLDRVRANVLSISRLVNVDIIAVVKSDAYGLGARRVAKAIGDLVSGV
jgi:alanine racemase